MKPKIKKSKKLTKKQTITFAVIIVSIIVGIIGYIYRGEIKNLFSKKTQPFNPDIDNNNNNTTTQKLQYHNCKTFPFAVGCSGEFVKKIQKILNLKYNSNIDEDGYFGENTKNALVKAGFGVQLDSVEINKFLKQ